MKVNGNEEKLTVNTESGLTTEWVFAATTLALTYSARQTAFIFTGEATTEITIPSEHTHLAVNGVETHVDLPGLTTTITVSSASNVIVNLPAVTTSLEFSEETYTFTVGAIAVSDDNGTKYCGDQTIAAEADQKTCVMGTTFTITLPSNAPDSVLYLNAPGVTTDFMLPGITTTFVQGVNFEYNRGELYQNIHNSKVDLPFPPNKIKFTSLSSQLNSPPGLLPRMINTLRINLDV